MAIHLLFLYVFMVRYIKLLTIYYDSIRRAYIRFYVYMDRGGGDKHKYIF